MPIELDWCDHTPACECPDHNMTVCHRCKEEGWMEEMVEHEVDYHHGTRIYHVCKTCEEE